MQTQPMPLYHTIVHNCDCHTFEDVIFGLMRIVGTGLRDAERKAREIDFFGRGIVAEERGTLGYFEREVARRDAVA